MSKTRGIYSIENYLLGTGKSGKDCKVQERNMILCARQKGLHVLIFIQMKKKNKSIKTIENWKFL